MATSVIVDISEVLRKLDPDKFRAEAEAAVGGAGDIVRAKIKRYPAPPPASTYRRTGTLGRSWTKTINRGSRWPEAIIGTHVKYAPYVHDNKRQAWMHQGRWLTAQEVLQITSSDVGRFIARAIERWARR